MSVTCERKTLLSIDRGVRDKIDKHAAPAACTRELTYKMPQAHGEFKVPGGKLVVADIEHDGERITAARIAGDFFLEPDSALDDINRAVLGLSVGASSADISAAVSAALDSDVTMLGFSAEAVGVVVRRALAKATGWRDYDWQLIHAAPQDPHLHLALDQVLAEEVAAGRRKPTLRIWEWEKPAVVIGSFQSVHNEVDMENAAKYGIPVVRRISGGGAMFMEAGSVVTYSIYAPTSLVEGLSFADSYAFLDDWVLVALRRLGINATYQPLNDISSDRGKIGGAAQKRLGTGAVMHHVTMSYNIDADKMVEVLRIGREKLSDKGTKSAKKRVDPLRAQTGLSRAQIIDALIDTFRELHGLTEAELTEDEVARAERLVEEKFATEQWLYRVP